MTVPTQKTARFCAIAAALMTVTLFAASAFAAPWGKLVMPDGKTVHTLDKNVVIVGSSKRATVRINHPTLSPKHIRLTHKKGVVFVEDLGSRLGTLVAGTELKKGKRMQLFQKTLLSLGALNLSFQWGDRGKLIAPLRKSRPDPKAKQKAAKPSKKAAKPNKKAARATKKSAKKR